jgi:endonuclease YncB( thermonuclease family)
MPRLLIIILLLFAAAPAAAPAAAKPAMEADGVFAVREVIDGDTLVLEDGSQVRLVGIQAPKLPLGRPNFPQWPLAPEAKAALESLALGKRLTLSYAVGGRRVDRHGRKLAHLFDEAHLWLQGEMLRRGLARVYTFPDNRALAADMLALEGEARAARRGIWADPYYRVLDAAGAAGHDETFQLVEGVVVRADSAKGRTYLNFGGDWKSDFTAVIEADARRMFAEDPARLQGRRVRVRGWMKTMNGPMIDVTHPEQIEVLR